MIKKKMIEKPADAYKIRSFSLLSIKFGLQVGWTIVVECAHLALIDLSIFSYIKIIA